MVMEEMLPFLQIQVLSAAAEVAAVALQMVSQVEPAVMEFKAVAVEAVGHQQTDLTRVKAATAGQAGAL